MCAVVFDRRDTDPALSFSTAVNNVRLHEFLDASKSHMADFRHRALRHHSEGIFQLEALFGSTITLSTGRVLPVRFIGEQHVLEDLGRIPAVADWLRKIQPEPWMLGRGKALAE